MGDMEPNNEVPENPLMDVLRAHLGQPLTEMPSPFGAWLSGVLRAIEVDGLEVVYVVRPEMTNPAQVLHGGVTAAMMDELIGMTLFAFSSGTYHATVNLAVDYLSPARQGETVVARSRIVRQGRRLVNVECALRREDGALVARATSNLLAVGS
jgi:acyl-coenzyme A thioesterase 13